MDALIVAIQMVLVGRIIYLAKLYMYSLLLESKPTSIYSHLTRNKKWKLWVGWHGSSLWLLCLCVLCVVFCAASKTIQCSRVSPYFIFWKMKIMSYVFWQISSSIKLRPEKITTGKKRYCVSFLASVLECHRWKMKIMRHLSTLILVVAVSVCVVFCVLCCFQNNPVFLSVTIFHILKNENYELCFLTNFFCQSNYDWEKLRKVKKDCVSFLASVLECHHISYFEKWKLWAMFFSRFFRWWNYDRKKLRQEKMVLC